MTELGPVDTHRRCPTRRSHPDGRRPGATRRRRQGRGHPGDPHKSFPWEFSMGVFHGELLYQQGLLICFNG